jgi:alpha-glucosidase
MEVQTRRDDAWWREAVLYQVYPRSFADSNGDGIGDLPGIVDRLEYLEWLGVDGLWLSPIFPSPNVDWGYDVADYTGVHPDLGTLADVDRLVEEAGRRGISVLLDLVPNHTSDHHPWFRERPELYVWSEGPPNNWRSIFGGPAWAHDADRGSHYLHNFAVAQPDLDWWNPEVHAEFEGILRFWFERGIAGFRIDVCHALYKDRDLRDDPPGERPGELRQVFSMNRPETHGVLRHWRRIADSFDPARTLVGEVYVLDVPRWSSYYGSGSDELDLAFNFALVHCALDADAMRGVVAETEAALPNDAQPCWIGSNHDVGRLTTRWCGGDEALARCVLLVLLGLRGTPCLFQGDELALPNGNVPEDRIRDVATPPRDPCRTPFPWTRSGGWDDPWLPLEDTSRNAADQRDDPGSALTFTRDLIALRRDTPDLTRGRYRELEAPAGAWAWRRGERTVIAVNLGSEPVEIREVEGSIAIATRRDRDGEEVTGVLTLDPAEGAVVRA